MERLTDLTTGRIPTTPYAAWAFVKLYGVGKVAIYNWYATLLHHDRRSNDRSTCTFVSYSLLAYSIETIRIMLWVHRLVGCFSLLAGLAHSYTATAASSTISNSNDETPVCHNIGSEMHGLKAGRLTSLVCWPRAISSESISSLQFDVQALRRMGFGASAGIASKHDTTTRRNVHQIWLQSPAGRPPEYFAGNMDARKDMITYLDSIRQKLSIDKEPLLRELAELSYLWYEPGASYMRHVDAFSDSASRSFRRTVSLILFLGDPTNDQPWDPEVDGGALRIYSRDTAGKERYHDIAPTPGTLVLFDSSTTPHEVLETHRTRSCIVGWFNTPQENL